MKILKSYTSEELEEVLNEIDKLYFEERLSLVQAIEEIRRCKKGNEWWNYLVKKRAA